MRSAIRKHFYIFILFVNFEIEYFTEIVHEQKTTILKTQPKMLRQIVKFANKFGKLEINLSAGYRSTTNIPELTKVYFKQIFETKRLF